MPATKTHPACTIHAECDYLKGSIKNGHIRKNLIQNGEPQRYSWETQKKKKGLQISQKSNPYFNPASPETLMTFGQSYPDRTLLGFLVARCLQGWKVKLGVSCWLANRLPSGCVICTCDNTLLVKSQILTNTCQINIVFQNNYRTSSIPDQWIGIVRNPLLSIQL